MRRFTFALLIAALAGSSCGGSETSAKPKISTQTPTDRLRYPDLEIFMEVVATDAQVEAVASALSDSPLIKRVLYLDKEDAYEEFKRLYPDRPDLLAATSAQDLPASFRVKLFDQEDIGAVKDTFLLTAGVAEVVVPDGLRQGVRD